MTDLSTKKKLIDIMGNRELSGLQKSLVMLSVVRDPSVAPEKHPELMRFILESYGLAPRHSTPLQEELRMEDSLVQRVRDSAQDRLDHEIKGWFNIHASRSVDRNMVDICMVLEEWTDDRERAVVFEMILSSSYIPIPVNFFSRITAEKSDEYILREHAQTYIQLRQLLNLNIDSTSRGSLIQELLQPLDGNERAKSVLLGVFVEELLNRLKKKSAQTTVVPAPSSAFNMPVNHEGLQAMMEKIQGVLPPEVLEQLRKLFSGGDNPFGPKF